MGELEAQDALCEQVQCAAATDQPAQLRRLSGADVLFAVFSSTSPLCHARNFLGFVAATEALRHPERRLGDFLVTAPPPSVGTAAPAEDLVWKFSADPVRVAAVAVFDEEGRFAGAVTPASLLVAQLRHSSDLQEKLRLYRKSVQKDKKKREEWGERLEQINRAFRKLITLLSRPAGPDLFQRGIETASMLLDASYGAVVFSGPQGQLKESILAGMTPGNDIRTFLRHRKPLVEQVLSTGAPLLVENVPQYLKEKGEDVGRHSLRTFLGVPIRREEHCFGCVYFCNRSEEESFTADDETLASSFANALALVMAQAQERAGRKRAEQERELLSELGLRLLSATTPESIGRAVAAIAGTLCPWHTFCLAVRRTGLNRFRYVTRLSGSMEAPEEMEGGELDLSRRPELLPLLEGTAVLSLKSNGGTSATIYAPVWGENEVAGILALERRGEPELGEADRVFLKRLADTIGPAVARCHVEARNAAFLSLAHQLTLTRTPTEAARVIVATADDLFGWDSCSVSLYYPDQDLGTSVLHMDLVDGARIEILGPYDVEPPAEISRRTMVYGPQLILRDSPESQTEGLRMFGNMTRRSLSLMFVPLRLGSSIVGVFSIQSYSPNAYTPRDLEFLQALADLCAGALERTRPAPRPSPPARKRKRG